MPDTPEVIGSSGQDSFFWNRYHSSIPANTYRSLIKGWLLFEILRGANPVDTFSSVSKHRTERCMDILNSNILLLNYDYRILHLLLYIYIYNNHSSKLVHCRLRVIMASIQKNQNLFSNSFCSTRSTPPTPPIILCMPAYTRIHEERGIHYPLSLDFLLHVPSVQAEFRMKVPILQGLPVSLHSRQFKISHVLKDLSRIKSITV